MKLKKPEIIAPVGDLVMLKAAIDAKADAIYFGTKELNMRSRAGNFKISEIKKVVNLCHKNNIKAYMTLNTIVYDNELNKIKKIITSAKKAGVDAIICWDMSVINEAVKQNMDFHISTQASISNFESVNFYAKLGAKKVVLARECTLEQIREIKKKILKNKLKVEIETFVHGAMCVSVSGRCFISQFMYNKSANRGECLQPCRREYDIKDKETGDELTIDNHYVMSPKDLCTITIIDKLIKAGIDSFKIEGRVKPPEYVKTVVTAYKTAVDAYFKGIFTKELGLSLEENLKTVFNRGFSNGFYMGVPINEFTDSYGGKSTTNKSQIGFVKNYYSKINVAEIKIESGLLKIGDIIMIQGPTTGVIEEKVESLQINHRDVDKVLKGKAVAIKLKNKVRTNDKVFLIKIKDKH